MDYTAGFDWWCASISVYCESGRYIPSLIEIKKDELCHPVEVVSMPVDLELMLLNVVSIL